MGSLSMEDAPWGDQTPVPWMEDASRKSSHDLPGSLCKIWNSMVARSRCGQLIRCVRCDMMCQMCDGFEMVCSKRFDWFQHHPTLPFKIMRYWEIDWFTIIGFHLSFTIIHKSRSHWIYNFGAYLLHPSPISWNPSPSPKNAPCQERLGNNRILYTDAGMKALRMGQQRNEQLRKQAWQTSPYGQKFIETWDCGRGWDDWDGDLPRAEHDLLDIDGESIRHRFNMV